MMKRLPFQSFYLKKQDRCLAPPTRLNPSGLFEGLDPSGWLRTWSRLCCLVSCEDSFSSEANQVRFDSSFTFPLVAMPTGDGERSATEDPGLWIADPVSPCQPHQQGHAHPPGRVRRAALPVPELADVQLCPLTSWCPPRGSPPMPSTSSSSLTNEVPKPPAREQPATRPPYTPTLGGQAPHSHQFPRTRKMFDKGPEQVERLHLTHGPARVELLTAAVWMFAGRGWRRAWRPPQLHQPGPADGPV